MKTGFVNGCFDILHIGHIALFEFGKSECDFLIVAIDSDDRIKQNKGSKRPFNNLQDRMKMLASIKFIDEVVCFDTDEELSDLVKKHNPDVMIVGEEYKNKCVIGSHYAKKLLFFRKLDGYSTTKILENSVNRG